MLGTNQRHRRNALGLPIMTNSFACNKRTGGEGAATRRLIGSIIGALVLAGMSIAGWAAPVTYAFDGHVRARGEQPERMPSIQVGDSFNGSITTDTELPRLHTDESNQGQYRGGRVSLTIAGRTWVSAAYPLLLEVLDSSPGDADKILFDAGFQDSTGPLVDDSSLASIVLILEDPSGTLLSGAGFPAEGLAGLDFDSGLVSDGFLDFMSAGNCDPCTAYITIDHFYVVTEPDSAALLTCVVAIFAVTRGRSGVPSSRDRSLRSNDRFGRAA